MLYGVMIELHPNPHDVIPRISLHSQLFADEVEAQEYIDKARRQNLPFKNKWIISFPDPRIEKED